MMRVESNLVMKYVEGLDCFVKFRLFPNEEIQKILRNARITDRRSYIQMVVRSCVVKMPRDSYEGHDGTESERRRNAEEHLYDVCISLNPALDINKVTVPVPQMVEERHEEAAPTTAKTKTLDVREIEGRLKERIVGQDDAVAAVALALKRAYAGIRDPERPVGTFLLMGQTGVGKTEMAKALAEIVSGDSRNMVRVDCSEYSLPHEYAKLIGAPPGYVGHEQGGYLASVMSEVDGGVVLFDEIEKADEKVHNLLLQVMDEGFVTDAKGLKVDFTDTLVILTSNLGAAETEALRQRMGFGMDRAREISHDERVEATYKAMKKRFKPEFLNRLDELIVFRTLTVDDADRILDKFIADLQGRTVHIGVQLTVSRCARKFLLEKGFSNEFGARELRRCVRKYLEAPLADILLERSGVSPAAQRDPRAADSQPSPPEPRHCRAECRSGTLRVRWEEPEGTRGEEAVQSGE